MPKHVLVINDTEEILELFQQILEGEGGYKVTIGTYKPHIIDDIKQLKPDLIITDYIFGQEHIGQQLVQKLHMDRDTADIPVIICSGALKELREQEGVLMDKGISILYKPFNVDELLDLVATRLAVAGKPTLSQSVDA